MVHGFLTPGFIFDQNVEALHVAGFRVLQFDHLGRDWSGRPARRCDTGFCHWKLLALLDALIITEPVGFVGLSMGGSIVAEFAVRHPERVARVFLFVAAGLDVALSGIPDPHAGDRRLAMAHGGHEVGREGPSVRRVRPCARGPAAGRCP